MKKSEITKNKILSAAEEAFSEKGLYGARVDEIAAMAGVNKRMIYAHYESKENLYINVINRVYTKMADAESELIRKHFDCIEAIESIIAHYFNFLSENKSFVKMVMWENLNEADYFKKSQARFIKGDATVLLKRKLRQGIESGIFREDIDVDEMIITINMMCFSYFSNIYTMAEIMQADFESEGVQQKRCRHVTEIILNYLKKN